MRTTRAGVFNILSRAFEHDRIKIGFGHRVWQPQLPVPEYDVFLTRELLQSDRALGMKPRTAQSDIAAESESLRVVKAGRGVDQYGARVHFAREP